jgi:hypothetical protein
VACVFACVYAVMCKNQLAIPPQPSDISAARRPSARDDSAVAAAVTPAGVGVCVLLLLLLLLLLLVVVALMMTHTPLQSRRDQQEDRRRSRGDRYDRVRRDAVSYAYVLCALIMLTHDNAACCSARECHRHSSERCVCV